MTQTRGEKNNNPGNVERTATVWQGMAQQQTDPRFIVFTNPHFGIRALARILSNYYREDGLNTVAGIIARWAPPKKDNVQENDTVAYINHVCAVCGVGEDAILKVDDPDCLEMLARAIILHENGRCIYDDATIVGAVDSALA